jgi:hypothetical protein
LVLGGDRLIFSYEQFTATNKLEVGQRKIRWIFDHLLSIGQLSAIPIFAKHIAA